MGNKITEKGPGDLKDYGNGSVKKLKLQADGNPFPYEREYNAEDGITDDSKVSQGLGESDYTPKAEKQTGDDGKG